MAGVWTIDPAASTAIDPWRRINLEIEIVGTSVTIEEHVSAGRRKAVQAYPLRAGTDVVVPVDWWTDNRHLAAYLGGDKTQTMRAEWLDDGRTLRVESHYILTTSQGDTDVREYAEYRLSGNGEVLTVITLRSSRDRPIVHVFKRS